MNYFSIRTNDQKTIGKILKKEELVVFDTLSWHKNEISIGDIVFIVISGDSSKKIHDYENGLRAIGKVIYLPKDEQDKKHFTLDVEIFEFLPNTLTKDDFYIYPSLKDAPNIGPDTKSAPNQAFRKIENSTGKSIIRAIIDLTNIINSEYDNILKGNYTIEKLNLIKDNNDKPKSQKKTLNDFIEWYDQPENFKKSYDGLVSYEILNFWDENFFNGKIFNIDKENFHENFIKIENAILDRRNEKWYKYSSATSKGAPEAIMGKNNYLKFLKNNYSNNLPLMFNDDLLNLEEFNYMTFFNLNKEANLNFNSKLILRFIASLISKPFVILSGLSGSGKTKIAQSFVQWICENDTQYKILPVGADWTNREPLVGYPNGLVAEEYVTPDSGVIHLLMEAVKEENKNKPFFLILDEMNLSHVERYFADFLSIMESNDTIKLYTGNKRKSLDGLEIELEIGWPKNVFIIGTVNIDETTYMFSPKVLDRANVIEFRITEEEIATFLNNPGIPDFSKLRKQGANMAENFLAIAAILDTDKNEELTNKLNLFFSELKKVGAEFGYRTASEIMQLVAKLKILETSIKPDECLDIAIMQKLLPKLHGSRSKLVKVLIALAALCIEDKQKEDFVKNFENHFKNDFDGIDIKFKISFEKLIRMYKNVLANGFTSYAEA
jgi:5-methylcytosine-specific restriction protein B